MKRKLEGKDKELTEKGINRIKQEVTELQESLEYNLAVLEKQKSMRIFEDKFRPYLRKEKNKKDSGYIKQIEYEIESREDKLKSLNKQLNEGVEVKQPIGV